MSHVFDVDLSVADIAAVTSADALAALLERLGYPTGARRSLSAAALGLADPSAVGDVELLCEDGEGFFRVCFARVKSITAKVRQDIVRALGRGNQDHLVILTKDFSRIELVLIAKIKHTSNLGEEGAYKPVARVITIDRASVDHVALRMLRRLTWTAGDGLAQYDKLRSVFEAAAFTGEYFQNRALFADHFLTTRLKEDAAWRESPNAAFKQIGDIVEAAKPQVIEQGQNAARAHLFEPLFKALGFAARASAARGDGQPGADYELRDGAGELRALALVYPWDRWLDGADERDGSRPTENPGAAVVSLLEKGDASWAVVTNGRHWRLYWRLAHSRSTNFYEVDLAGALRASDAHDADPNEAFRYFWLFFREDAFAPVAADGKTTWLDAIVQGSRDYAREVERELKQRVFHRVVPVLAKGFLADRAGRMGIKRPPDDEELETIRQGTLTLLYRILFLLYAESRDLLPVRESNYFDLSLRKMEREIAQHAGVAESDSDQRLAKHYAADGDDLYLRLAKLFAAMDAGDAALNVPAYNGGLFRAGAGGELAGNRDAAIARFLREYRVPDYFLALAIDHLARVPDARQGFALAFVDYKSLGVRQLGSIYEGLLEYRLFVAGEDLVESREKTKIVFRPLNAAASGTGKTTDKANDSKRVRKDATVVRQGEVYLANDRAQRKATGSYYTPENIVAYIVEHTVGPVLERKLEALVPEFRKAEQTYRRLLDNARNNPKVMLGSGLAAMGAKPGEERFRAWAAKQAYESHRDLVDKLFEMKVLDPAMGSGHFLVDAVDFITDKLLVWLNRFQPFNPVLAMLDRARRDILESLSEQGVGIDPDRLTDVHLLKRHVLKRCVYGVDLNPLATELAKVSLWLDAFTLGAPLSFLDHHLRVGNSLIGASFADLEKLTGGNLFAMDYEPMLRAVRNVLLVSRVGDVTAAEVHESAGKYGLAREALDGYRLVLDLIVARHFGQPKATALITEAADLKFGSREEFVKPLNVGDAEIVKQTEIESARRRFFHWELEFPEVFFHYRDGSKQHIERMPDGQAGFDCVIGNPPYLGVRTGDHEDMFNAYVKAAYAGAARNWDLASLFLEHALDLGSQGAGLGMIVPSRIATNRDFGPVREGFLCRGGPTMLIECGAVFDDPNVLASIIVHDPISMRPGVDLGDLVDGETRPRATVDRDQLRLLPDAPFTTRLEPKHIDRFRVMSAAPRTLAYYVDITRGMECGKNDPNVSAANGDGRHPVISGEGVLPFRVRPQGLYIPLGLQPRAKYKSPELFLTKPKLLARFVASHPIVAIDEFGYANFNTVYNLTPRHGGMRRLSAIAAILNSEVVRWWFRIAYNSEESIFPHIQKYQLEAIPMPDLDDLRRLCDLLADAAEAAACPDAPASLPDAEDLAARAYGLVADIPADRRRVKQAEEKLCK